MTEFFAPVESFKQLPSIKPPIEQRGKSGNLDGIPGQFEELTRRLQSLQGEVTVFSEVSLASRKQL
jgi:hypothetical protein